MPGPSCSLSRTQIRVSHFADTEPGQPGMTSRTGPPWMFGSGWPFIAQTIRLFSSIAFLIGTPRDSASLLASPERCGSAP